MNANVSCGAARRGATRQRRGSGDGRRDSASRCDRKTTPVLIPRHSLRPQVAMRLSLPPFSRPPQTRSTHRHCGVSDRVARRLPYLRRAARLQQVLGESAARLGRHLLSRALTAHPSTCSPLRWQPLRPPRSLSRADRAVFTHARARALVLRCAHGGAGCQKWAETSGCDCQIKARCADRREMTAEGGFDLL